VQALVGVPSDRLVCHAHLARVSDPGVTPAAWILHTRRAASGVPVPFGNSVNGSRHEVRVRIEWDTPVNRF